ncbi:hypothetical protein [Streptomyces sp. NPDC093261]|uniref:hypothetical protein n=1 Tax=Streptomyces sp. NPDC093261 TaxID=3366037 RepID=UPI003808A096
MAAPVSLRKLVPHRYEWLVPADDGSKWPRAARYERALAAAQCAYRTAFGLVDDGEPLLADALTIEKDGEDVLISFVVDEPEPAPPAPRKGR